MASTLSDDEFDKAPVALATIKIRLFAASIRKSEINGAKKSRRNLLEAIAKRWQPKSVNLQVLTLRSAASFDWSTDRSGTWYLGILIQFVFAFGCPSASFVSPTHFKRNLRKLGFYAFILFLF